MIPGWSSPLERPKRTRLPSRNTTIDSCRDEAWSAKEPAANAQQARIRPRSLCYLAASRVALTEPSQVEYAHFEHDTPSITSVLPHQGILGHPDRRRPPVVSHRVGVLVYIIRSRAVDREFSGKASAISAAKQHYAKGSEVITGCGLLLAKGG